ncbi:dihydrofolate reductase family protein [Marinicella meishanensis]|uniref:dihydrofolate reductase family protein n=1 Tax=Marinicella meishanensis TaxID=2873263 RepID=UPI001CBE830B|nr:dihydrofolate reductase family protein [Marinicella sp. NBU2979]
MKCSVFIASSLDGFIATEDGAVDWLYQVGQQDADLGAEADMGFEDYIQSVDCMIMGRGCMEVLAGMQLSAEQWPYGHLKVVVLSQSVTTPPATLPGPVTIHAGDISNLLESLAQAGHRHAYIDGGATITSFLRLGMIDEMTITRAPVLLGRGIRLFGELTEPIELQQTQAKVFANDFLQERYRVKAK